MTAESYGRHRPCQFSNLPHDPEARFSCGAVQELEAQSNPVIFALCRASLGLWDDDQSRLGILSGSGFASDVIVSQQTGRPACAGVRAGLVGIPKWGRREGCAAGRIAGYVAVSEFRCRLSLATWSLGDVAVSDFRRAPGMTRSVACDRRAAELCG